MPHRTKTPRINDYSLNIKECLAYEKVYDFFEALKTYIVYVLVHRK